MVDDMVYCSLAVDTRRTFVSNAILIFLFSNVFKFCTSELVCMAQINSAQLNGKIKI